MAELTIQEIETIVKRDEASLTSLTSAGKVVFPSRNSSWQMDMFT